MGVANNFFSEFLSDNEFPEVMYSGAQKVLETADENLSETASDSKKISNKLNKEDSACKVDGGSKQTRIDSFHIRTNCEDSADSLTNYNLGTTKESGASVKTLIIRERKVKLPSSKQSARARSKSPQISKNGEPGRQLATRTMPAARSRSPSCRRSQSRSISPTVPVSKTPPTRRRSHSRSASPLLSNHSRLGRRIHCSRSPSRRVSSTKCRSPTPSKSFSTVGSVSKFARKRERSPSMVDARELINRKRAMIQASDVLSKGQSAVRKKIDSVNEDADVEIVEKCKASGSFATKSVTSGTHMIRIKNRNRSKENVNVDCKMENKDDDVNSDDDDGRDEDRFDDNFGHSEAEHTNYPHDYCAGSGSKAQYSKLNEKPIAKLDRPTLATNYSRFVINKRDGRRSITFRSVKHDGDSENHSTSRSSVGINSGTTANSIAVISAEDTPGSRVNQDFRVIRRTVHSTERDTMHRLPEVTPDDEENDDKTEVVHIMDDDAALKKEVKIRSAFKQLGSIRA